MTSSSSRARLATAAVLGISALGMLPSGAIAAPVANDYPATVASLLSQFSGVASYQADGTDETVRLEAGAGSSVSQVRFSYRVSTNLPEQIVPFTTIATVTRNDNGAFATEWDPSSVDGFPVDIRVAPLNSAGAAVGAASTTVGVEVTTDWTANIAGANDLGYFVQPYATSMKTATLARLTGTVGRIGTNASRTMEVGWFQNTSDGTAVTTVRKSSGTETQGIGTFNRQLDLSQYTFGTNLEDDDVVTYAQMLNGTTPLSDDTESYKLRPQTLKTITATPDRTTVIPGETASVTVKVLDTFDQPMVGVEVRRSPGGASDPVGYTNAAGAVTFLQAPGTASYFANATDGDAFSAAEKDIKTSDVVIEGYQPVTTKLVATSADGDAFDIDEADNTPGTGTGTDGDPTDITVQVKDQKGNNVAAGGSQVLGYYWQVTPFAGGSPTRYPATGTSQGVSEGGGKFSTPLPTGVTTQGTYELFAELTRDTISSSGAIASSSLKSVKVGQASITYDRNSPEEAAAGTTTTVTGRLALSDGTTLPGRALAFTFQRDTTTTGEDPTPDAGFGNGSGSPTTSATATTTATGTFSLQVYDPAETPQQSELGDNIDAASAANDLGNAGAAQNDHVVNFVQDSTVSALTLTESRESSTLRPGEFTLYTVKVANRLGGGIANQDVKLTTDKGYFSLDDGSAATTSPTAAPSPSAGADAGTYRNDTQTVTLKTGSDGTATVFLAMGRDTGFDDDGQLVTKVTATSGALTATDDHSWNSANPLKGGAVAVVASDRAQDSAILPKAQTSDKVYVDVLVTDQFGNAVGGESVSLTDDSAGTIAESDGTADDGTIVSDFAKEGDATLSSAVGTAQKVTASWTTERTTYTGTGTATTTGTETLTGSYTAEWYVVDYAASDITFTPDGSGTREVGSSVTMTYKALDQLGQPISDLYVDFSRTGPGSSTDSATAADTLTGADGTATYTFTGASSGKADITATARRGSATGEVVTAASRTASVTFAQDAVKPDITVTKGVRGNRLILKVTVTASTQDPVTGDVQVSENGDTLATKVLNSDGKRKFVIRGVDRGFHSYQVTFLGNDEVKQRTRTVTINIR